MDDEVIAKPAPEPRIPSRPYAGQVVLADWGGQVHDAVFYPPQPPIIMDSGVWSFSWGNSWNDYAAWVNFGVVFSGKPAVVATLNSEQPGQEFITVRAVAVSNMSFAMKLTLLNGALTQPNQSIEVSWIARGWRSGADYITTEPALPPPPILLQPRRMFDIGKMEWIEA